MGNFNKKTQKAVVVVKAVAPRPIITIPNRNQAGDLTNAELTQNEATKVADFLALHGDPIPGGSTVGDMISAAIGDANPEAVGNRFSIRLSQAHRITYRVFQNAGLLQGDPMQFAIHILTIGDAPYAH